MLQSLHGNCKRVKNRSSLAHSSYGKAAAGACAHSALCYPHLELPCMMLPRIVLTTATRRYRGKSFLVVTKLRAPSGSAIGFIRGYLFRQLVLHRPMLQVHVIVAGTL